MSRFAFFNIFYLSAAAVLGVYGSMFAAFQPAAFWLEVAKLLSFAFFIYFLAIGVVFFVKNKDIIMARSSHKLLKNGFRFNIFIFLLYPITVVVLSYAHYQAISKGFPSVYTGIFSEERTIEAAITNKRLWGKRDRHEQVSISGFSEGFPVTRSFYNSVSVGQRINVSVSTSAFGSKVKFIQP